MLQSDLSPTTNWKAVVTYFFLATGISLIFRAYHPLWLDFLKLPYGFGLNLLVGFGPLLAAEITRILFKNNKERLPWHGLSLFKSLLFMLAPVAVLAVLGIVNKKQINEHWFAVHVSLLWLIYIIGEEAGWRGYLQQILKMNDIQKSLIVGLQWYIWHLSFLFEKTNAVQELIFLAVLLAGSFIAIKITHRTSSLLTAVGLHFSFSVMTNVPQTAAYKYGILVMLLIWAVLLYFWPQKKPVTK